MKADAKTVIGLTIRRLRETAGLSQEKLAERAGFTYQHLSAIENGKENFTIGILESLAKALSLDIPQLIECAFADPSPLPVVKPEFFIRQACLPPHLTFAHIASALNETHNIVRLLNGTLRRVAGRQLSAYIQGNNFSGIVSNILCDSFSRLTPYKHNHDQRYPDLVCKSGTGLEVKSTIRPGKGGESHNGHSGWHVVACFALDATSGDIRFVHVMFADLIGHGKPHADWQYVGSKVNTTTGSQRTETYTTTPEGTAKLRHGSAYLDRDLVNITRWRTSPSIAAPPYSPFVKPVK
jgi:transcriptional regulator with XRE-family HTH domain